VVQRPRAEPMLDRAKKGKCNDAPRPDSRQGHRAEMSLPRTRKELSLSQLGVCVNVCCVAQQYRFAHAGRSSNTRRSMDFKLMRSLQCTTGSISRLHHLLSELELNGQGEIMSWQPHGRAFRVHDKERLVKEVLSLWFRQTRYASFNRQLNLYGFQRFSKGTRVRRERPIGMRS